MFCVFKKIHIHFNKGDSNGTQNADQNNLTTCKLRWYAEHRFLYHEKSTSRFIFLHVFLKLLNLSFWMITVKWRVKATQTPLLLKIFGTCYQVKHKILSQCMTKQTKSQDSDQHGHPPCPFSSLHALWVAKDLMFLHADSEDSDQTGLIWVFTGRTIHSFCWFCRAAAKKIIHLYNSVPSSHNSTYKICKKCHMQTTKAQISACVSHKLDSIITSAAYIP